MSLPSCGTQPFPVAGFSRSAAFSLIEILVACAVLALIVVLLAATFSNFANVTSVSGRRMESGNQSRTVFDRLELDLASSIRSSGVEIKFFKNDSGNDELAFLANARPVTVNAATTPRMAKIGYEVPSANTGLDLAGRYSLSRDTEPFSWNDSAVSFLSTGTNSGLIPFSTLITSAAQQQMLGRGIFRFELSFLKTDGTIKATAPDFSEVAAIICSTAALDESTIAKLTAGQMTDLMDALGDSVDGSLPTVDSKKQAWSVERFASFPDFVKQNVRFNQRYFYLK